MSIEQHQLAPSLPPDEAAPDIEVKALLHASLDKLGELATQSGESWRMEWAAWAIQAAEARVPSADEVSRLADHFADQLHQHLSDSLREGAGMLPVSGEALPLDLVFAKYVEDHASPEASMAASAIREEASDRGLHYRQTGSAEGLCELWRNPEWLAYFLLPLTWLFKRPVLSDRYKAPAISIRVMEATKAAFWDRKRRAERRGDTWVIVGRGESAVGWFSDLLAPEAVSSIVEHLPSTTSLDCHRLVRFLIHEGFRGFERNVRDFRRVRIPGGLSGLARRLGIWGDKATSSLRFALEVLQHVKIPLPHGEANGLLTWTLRAAARGRPAELTIVIGDPLLAHYVVALPKTTRSQLEARRLVPIPERLPPLVGHQWTHASQSSLQWLVLAEFRHQARELVGYNSVRIPLERWRELAHDAGLPQDKVADVIEAWVSGDDSFLLREKADPWKFTLGYDHDSALRFLHDAGGKELLGAEYQARAKTKKRWNRKSKTKKPG
jgi:hypothetical protein